AAINGACAGGGWELALACDFRIAVEEAKIGLPETTLGLLPCWGGTVRMTQKFGQAIASQMILTGELIKAKAAFKKGLLHEVCEVNEFEEQLSNLKTTLLSRSPFAQKMARKVIAKTAAREHQASLGFSDERNAFLACVRSGQVAIGVEAFLGKKTPVWV
ncbi:enoyl-CoA hydratase/isomerase family protein, partial [uncultured Rubinisphaera sp.]|uniref:enoyl-CoA hydratase/isomerase family protein n=1 Tax=uncultured Rubinisphaera sp. TaxID=1678686 RepID=UPI0030DA7A0B